MSGHPTCGFCKLEMGYVCTGASGCVWAELRKAEEAMRRGERAHTTPATEPHPDRENQASKSAPTGHNVPAGKADGAAFDMLMPSETWDHIGPHPLVPYGFAPGGYFCRCSGCGREFSGDKRAHHCRVCAERRLHDVAEIHRLWGENQRYMRLHQTQGANIRFLMKERAARDFAVADAVREAVLANMRARWPEVTDGLYQDISAIDLASVIAMIKEDAR